jgi:hypothetical protein
MIEKDFILNETEKLAITMAHLMGLKADNKIDECIQLVDQTLLTEYGIDLKSLCLLKIDDFKNKLVEDSYSAVKLDVLAQLLYASNELSVYNSDTRETMKKVLIIFDILEQKHRRQSFENITKRTLIDQFLKRTV